MVKYWDITIDEFIHVLQVMKEESGGDTIIGTATDVTEELKFLDTKVRGWDGMWKHKKAIRYDTKLISSEMVMKEEEEEE